jgi:type IV pilus assembly protein PilV
MQATVDCPVHPERGFSIAELLAAIIVLAVGVLGVVALYLDRAQEQTHDPHVIATKLAQEMAERIRARGSAGATRLQIAPFCTQAAEGEDGSNAPVADTLAHDAACWQEKVARSLPNGSGMIQREDPQKGYRITVSWSEAGMGAASVVMHVR